MIPNNAIPAGTHHNALSYEEIKNLVVSQSNSGTVLVLIVITVVSIPLLLFFRSNKTK